MAVCDSGLSGDFCIQYSMFTYLRSEMFSVQQCPDGMVPTDNTCGCQATCADPTAPSHCNLPNKEKCVCPDGTILFDGHCVPCCGCTEDDGTVHQVMESKCLPGWH